MGEKTAIAWTDHTFNIVWGCIEVSEECTRCYARTMAERWGHKIWGPKQTTERRTFGEKHWAEPLRWNDDAFKRGVQSKVFCSSMADLFEDHPTVIAEQPKLWKLIEDTPFLIWQLLTKRPENVIPMIPPSWRAELPPNVWLGTSVGVNSSRWRIDAIREVPARVRFLSCEPLLEDLYLVGGWLSGIHWLIGGGESGPRGRWLVERCDVAEHDARCCLDADDGEKYCARCPNGYRPTIDGLLWARSLRDQAAAWGVSFFWKQWGGPHNHAGGRLLDGVEHNEFPRVEAAV